MWVSEEMWMNRSMSELIIKECEWLNKKPI